VVHGEAGAVVGDVDLHHGGPVHDADADRPVPVPQRVVDEIA
jgi:hypothetical protein